MLLVREQGGWERHGRQDALQDALDEAMDPGNKVDDKADAGLGDGNDFGGGSFVDTGAKGSLQPGSV